MGINVVCCHPFTLHKYNGKLNNCFSVALRGFNLFVGPPRNVKHTLYSKGGYAPGRVKRNLALCDLTGMTDLFYQMCFSSLVCKHPSFQSNCLQCVAALFWEELIACAIGGPLTFELNCWPN